MGKVTKTTTFPTFTPYLIGVKLKSRYSQVESKRGQDDRIKIASKLRQEKSMTKGKMEIPLRKNNRKNMDRTGESRRKGFLLNRNAFSIVSKGLR